MEKIVYTIGTSKRKLKEFMETLKFYGIKRAIDVRHYPTSSMFPHFKGERLSDSLPKSGIDYLFLGEQLGGYRRGGYESYVKTASFKKGLKSLDKAASEKLSVIFCAEKLFWRCHRRFIADALIKQGWKVVHILGKENVREGKTAGDKG